MRKMITGIYNSQSKQSSRMLSVDIWTKLQDLEMRNTVWTGLKQIEMKCIEHCCMLCLFMLFLILYAKSNVLTVLLVFSIENMVALLAVEPPAGVLAPGESKHVSLVTSAGRLPQRIRDTLEGCVYDMKGSSMLSSQFLSVRG